MGEEKLLENGYGIMPNVILFDEELPATAKLLFVYISSLCAERGFAWAGNEHMADRFGISERAVRGHISTLYEKGYITIQDGTNHLRKLRIGVKQISPEKNFHPPGKKVPSSPEKNFHHNITSGNNTSVKRGFYKNDSIKRKNLQRLDDIKKDHGFK